MVIQIYVLLLMDTYCLNELQSDVKKMEPLILRHMRASGITIPFKFNKKIILYNEMNSGDVNTKYFNHLTKQVKSDMSGRTYNVTFQSIACDKLVCTITCCVYAEYYVFQQCYCNYYEKKKNCYFNCL